MSTNFEPYGACSLDDLYDRLVAPSLDSAIERWLAEDFGDAGDLTTTNKPEAKRSDR